jgi:hypothetical protein
MHAPDCHRLTEECMVGIWERAAGSLHGQFDGAASLNLLVNCHGPARNMSLRLLNEWVKST